MSSRIVQTGGSFIKNGLTADLPVCKQSIKHSCSDTNFNQARSIKMIFLSSCGGCVEDFISWWEPWRVLYFIFDFLVISTVVLQRFLSVLAINHFMHAFGYV